MLFDRHHDRVWRHALKVLGLPHVAEDVTAVVFYEIWRRRANIRMVNNSASLLVTTNNTLRNHVRQQRRYRHFLSQLPPPVDEAEGSGPSTAGSCWSKRLTLRHFLDGEHHENIPVPGRQA
jgi:RNA polymerase sigma-70 factor (ECF subfamily)